MSERLSKTSPVVSCCNWHGGGWRIGAWRGGVGQAKQAKNTAADYTPGDKFEPLAASSPCVGALDDPFVLPSGYNQQVVARSPRAAPWTSGI